MIDMLDKMNEEKRIRLINSGMKEFGANRFDKASTNVIVKEAGISKGLLYHYFKSKEALFDYLVVFTMTRMGTAIVDSIQWGEGDLIDRIYQVSQIKLAILEQHPYMMDFGKAMYEAKSLEEVKEMVSKYIPDIYHKLYSYNIDYSLFKEQIDVKRVIKMIQLFLDGYLEAMLIRFKSSPMSTKMLKEEMLDLYQYLEMYKVAFYKSV